MWAIVLHMIVANFVLSKELNKEISKIRINNKEYKNHLHKCDCDSYTPVKVVHFSNCTCIIPRLQGFVKFNCKLNAKCSSANSSRFIS